MAGVSPYFQMLHPTYMACSKNTRQEQAELSVRAKALSTRRCNGNNKLVRMPVVEDVSWGVVLMAFSHFQGEHRTTG